MKSAVAVRQQIAQMIRPPERISVVDAATKYVKVRTATNSVDNWNPDLTPYMHEPMNCLTSRKYDAVVFVGPAQSGKTQGLITCFMAYIIKCDPADFLIMQTTKGTARDFDTQVIKRAFRDSPELKSELAPGSKSDNTYDKVFKSGAVLFQRWPSINEISGKPLKYVLITDYDRGALNIDGEGSKFALSQQRTAKFLSRGMTLAETSPGFDITDNKKKTNYLHEAPPCDGALSLYNMGDMRRYYVQCPECKEYFMPPPDETSVNFSHDRDLFDTTIAEITRPISYICTNNGCMIDITHKREMNRTAKWLKQGESIKNGEIVGDGLNKRIASFWFPGVFAAYSDPTALVQKFLDGYREFDITGSEENLKTTLNVSFGAAYLPRNLADLDTGGELSDRAEDLKRYYVPSEARLLIAAVDIQNGKNGRFEVEVHAIGENMEQWIVDRFKIEFREIKGKKRRIEPGVYSEDWDLLIDKVVTASYKTHDGRKMMVHLTMIDSGGNGNTTDNAYQFYRRLRKLNLSQKVWLLKGGSHDTKTPITPSFGKDKNGRKMRDVPIQILNPNSFKDKVQAMLNRQTVGGLYLHVSQWLPSSYYDELYAEVRLGTGKWDKIRERNESLDLCCYILAGCWKLGLNNSNFNWSTPPKWALPIESGNINVVDVDTARNSRATITSTNNFYIPD